MKTSFLFRPRTGISRFVASHLIVLGLAFGACATAPSLVSPAFAQNAPSIGVVDSGKLKTGFQKLNQALDAIDKNTDDREQRLSAREFLTEEEGKNFDGLFIKEKLTPAEVTQFDSLTKLGRDRRSEHTSISGNPNRNETDNKRLQVLQDMVNKNQVKLQNPMLNESVTIVQNLLFVLDRMQQSQKEKVRGEMQDKAESIVSQIASDKKLQIIVDKSVAWYAAPTLDITDELLKRLNAA